MILNEYNEIIREYFDISDTKTRKFIVALEDTEQNQLLTALSSALYDKIVQKVDKIDFGTIPMSRGDITKVDGFENTLECLNIMRNLVLEYRQKTDIIDTALSAIENVKMRKGIFMKSYSMNIEMPMLTYNLIVLAIEQSVSFLIDTCIQYIKDPATETMSAALDKVAYNNSRDELLYNQLISFNKSCLTKELDFALNEVIKHGGSLKEDINDSAGNNDVGAGVNSIIINVGKGTGAEISGKPIHHSSPFKDEEPNNEIGPEVPINGDCASGECDSTEPVDEIAPVAAVALFAGKVIGGTVAAAAVASLSLKAAKFLIKGLIPILRNITYIFYNTKMKFSDALASQAQLIESNANRLKYSDSSSLTDEKKKKVIEKQMKIAEKLRSWSNKVAIDRKNANKNAQKMIDDENKQMKIDDLKDELPPDIGDGGLF